MKTRTKDAAAPALCNITSELIDVCADECRVMLRCSCGSQVGSVAGGRGVACANERQARGNARMLYRAHQFESRMGEAFREAGAILARRLSERFARAAKKKSAKKRAAKKAAR